MKSSVSHGASATVEESHVKSWEDQSGSREIQFPDLSSKLS